jgi:hypothetical protein
MLLRVRFWRLSGDARQFAVKLPNSADLRVSCVERSGQRLTLSLIWMIHMFRWVGTASFFPRVGTASFFPRKVRRFVFPSGTPDNLKI